MSRIRIPQLSEKHPGVFPSPALAMHEPNGLLAWGGGLEPEWLLPAYQQGIFPWFNPGEPILWWSPDPRFGFVPGTVHLGRSRRRALRHKQWTVRADTCFEQVVAQCANEPRKGQAGTWISDGMRIAYTRLHALGHGHSIEVFEDNHLIGGLYGLAIGQVFFAESMFSTQSQASALALYALSRTLKHWQWPWIDAQMQNPHLSLLGGQALPRTSYLSLLQRACKQPGLAGSWQSQFSHRRWLED